jgi:hypothetical protein
MMVESGITGVQDFIREQGPSFDLVGTSQTVVVCETLGFTRTMCQSGSSPTGCISIRVPTTLSDMSNRLSVVVIT